MWTLIEKIVEAKCEKWDIKCYLSPENRFILMKAWINSINKQ